MDDIAALKAELNRYRYNEQYPDEAGALHCCRLAMAALEKECYGVGAILISPQGQILVQAHNRVFIDGFHPDRHAEMVLLDRFEHEYPDYGDRSELTLMVSLEPCPMCLCRLLASGIGSVRYLVSDPDGGMVERQSGLPPAWQDLAQLQHPGKAHISPALKELATRLGGANREALRQRLMGRIRKTV